MTAADRYTGLPGNENVGWTLVALIALAALIIWAIREFRRMHTEKRDVDSLLEFEDSTHRARCRHLIPTRAGQLDTCNAPARRRPDGCLVCDEHSDQCRKEAS